MQPGTKKMRKAQETPLISSLAANTVANDSCFVSVADGKENMDGKHGHGWLAKVSKVCSKLCNKQPRFEKCEKCGQKSDTCVANPSFLSSRKHYLCDACRVSTENVKTAYRQLYRNLSLHEPPRLTCNSTDLSPSSSRGVVRSRSMRNRPPAPESGYDTATSLSSSCSIGRLSPDSYLVSQRDIRPCPRLAVDGHYPNPYCCDVPQSTPRCHHAPCGHVTELHHAQNAVYPRDKPDVFGGALKSEKAHLREIQVRPRQKVYTRQQPVPQHQEHHQQGQPQHHLQKQPLHKDNTKYDGFLEIRTPNSQSVKYVFRQRQDYEKVEREEMHNGQPGHSDNSKQCYRCNKVASIAFRAPFCNGWLCEDCMDDLM